MAHVMKHTKASCGHMFAHFDRRAEHISNENLDRTRTHLNYNLAIHQQMDQGEFVRKRCSEVRMQNRKDVNIMASWVVTVPKDLPLEEHKQFFQGCYDFLENRYGKENVVSSYVHMDEITPHMHFAFVPVVPDKKRDGFKVSAKECITRTDLQSFHQQLETHLENVLGHEVGILNEATREGNKSIAELKRSGATERLKSVEKEIEAKKDSLIPLQAEYEAKKAFVKQIGKLSRDTSLYPEGVKISKKIFGEEEIVTVPKEMWEKTRKLYLANLGINRSIDTLDKNLEEFYNSASMERIEDLELEVKDLRQELRNKEVQLHREKNTSKETLAKINQVLQSIPADAAEEFQKAWNAPGHNRGRDR